MFFYLHTHRKQTEKEEEWYILVLEMDKHNITKKKKKNKPRVKAARNQHPKGGGKILSALHFVILHRTDNSSIRVIQSNISSRLRGITF